MVSRSGQQQQQQQQQQMSAADDMTAEGGAGADRQAAGNGGQLLQTDTLCAAPLFVSASLPLVMESRSSSLLSESKKFEKYGKYINLQVRLFHTAGGWVGGLLLRRQRERERDGRSFV